MDVKDAILERRAYRALEPVEITEELMNDLAQSARLAPSCFNSQPWRFVFVHDERVLIELWSALSKSNEWIHRASLIIVVFTRKDLDCDIRGREYFLFDTGMATAFIILRATELELIAHPIAGFKEDKVKEILGIPENMRVITLVNLGKHSKELTSEMTESQKEIEKERPGRLSLDKFVYMNRYTGEGE
jgi:nitroreductase